ncbi:MAG: sodium:solute symporter [Bacteriovoracia bacterium]
MLVFQPQIHYSEVLSILDWAVFGLVLIAAYGAVIYASRRKVRLEASERAAGGKGKGEASYLDFLLMGRRLTLPLFVASLMSSWYGGIFGVTQIAFEKGVYNFVTQGFFWYLTYAFFALVLVKRVRRFEAVTLPDIVAQVFGPRSAKLSAVFNFFNMVPIAYAMSLGLFLQALFGFSLLGSTVLGMTLVVSYCITSGFRGDVYSDVVLFFVMCASVAMVVVCSWWGLGGWSYLAAHLPATHFEPMGGESLASVMVWGFIALSTLVDPTFYQLCFAAESEKTARRGILVCTVIWCAFDICTTLGGMYARAAIPEADAKGSYLIYALQLLPPGARGFFVAGILATIVSTVDTFLFIAGTTVAHDLLPARWRGRVSAHRVGIISVAVLSIGMAQFFSGNIKHAWKTMGSFWSACLLFPLMYGFFFPRRVRDGQFMFTCLLGAGSVIVWRYVGRVGFWSNVDALYIGFAATGIALVAFHLWNNAESRSD